MKIEQSEWNNSFSTKTCCRIAYESGCLFYKNSNGVNLGNPIINIFNFSIMRVEVVPDYLITSVGKREASLLLRSFSRFWSHWTAKTREISSETSRSSSPSSREGLVIYMVCFPTCAATCRGRTLHTVPNHNSYLRGRGGGTNNARTPTFGQRKLKKRKLLITPDKSTSKFRFLRSPRTWPVRELISPKTR